MPTAAPAPTRQRILDALVDRIADTGWGKLTIDDIARRAGLSRVTLYSYFPNKHAIVEAAVLRELERFFTELETARARYDAPEERLVETFAHAYRYLRAHPLAQRMIRSEPEILATYVAGDTPAIPLARDWVAGRLAEPETRAWLGDTDPHEAAEVIVRAIHSLVIAPATVFPLDEPDGPQAYARRWIVPAITGSR